MLDKVLFGLHGGGGGHGREDHHVEASAAGKSVVEESPWAAVEATAWWKGQCRRWRAGTGDVACIGGEVEFGKRLFS